jgi:hypothetical protein
MYFILYNFVQSKFYKIKYIILYGLKLKFVKNSWSGCWCNVIAAPVKLNWISGRFGGCTKLYKIKYIILLDYNSWFRKCGCWGNASRCAHNVCSQRLLNAYAVPWCYVTVNITNIMRSRGISYFYTFSWRLRSVFPEQYTQIQR